MFQRSLAVAAISTRLRVTARLKNRHWAGFLLSCQHTPVYNAAQVDERKDQVSNL